jgi:transposase-like protein
MIIESIICKCTKCGSENIVRNGHDNKGKQKFNCKECGFSSILNPYIAYSEEKKEEIINAYYERSSMRGIERVFGVARQTLAKWLKKNREITSFNRNT